MSEWSDQAERAEAMLRRGEEQAERIRRAVEEDTERMRAEQADRREATRPLRRGAP